MPYKTYHNIVQERLVATECLLRLHNKDNIKYIFRLWHLYRNTFSILCRGRTRTYIFLYLQKVCHVTVLYMYRCIYTNSINNTGTNTRPKGYTKNNELQHLLILPVTKGFERKMGNICLCSCVCVLILGDRLWQCSVH